MRFLTIVARSASRVWKLWTGSPAAVHWVRALARVSGETWRAAPPTPRGLRRVRIGVLEQQRGEPPLHVPLDVVGQHADEHVGAHAVFQVVVDRADLQVHRLEAAEGTLDGAEALVGAHGVGRPSSSAATLVRTT